jgi:signal transduction histidine kinase
MSSVEPPGGAQPNRWPQLYFALAGFDLLTVMIGLAVTHYLVGQHLSTTQEHFRWASRLERYAGLAETATHLNIAGNQIFETGDPAEAREAVERAAIEFSRALTDIRQELRNGVAPGHRERLLNGFDRTETALNDQIREARDIIRLFMKGDRQSAGAHMVQMDRHHAELVLALTQVSREVAAIESAALSEHAETARILRGLELGLAGLIALMVIGIAFYGTRLTRMVQATAQREAETSRMLADQMAQIAQVATGMAHEIRNPLTSIKLLVQENRVELTEHGVPDSDLEIVESEVDRMERKLNTFLQFARPSPPDIQTIDLVDSIRQTLALIRLRAESQNVNCETHVETEIPASDTVRVSGDADQIQQVLLNLALNSLDAMLHGGTLTVSVSNKHFDSVHVTVADTGMGIPDSVRDRLFEPFVTSKSAGIGLGLVVCRQIIERHNGVLTGSNSAEGAVFEFTLPGEAGLRAEGNNVNTGSKVQTDECA